MFRDNDVPSKARGQEEFCAFSASISPPRTRQTMLVAVERSVRQALVNPDISSQLSSAAAKADDRENGFQCVPAFLAVLKCGQG